MTKKWCLHRKEIGPDGERVFSPITFHDVYRGRGEARIYVPSDPNFPQVCQTLEKDGREEEGKKSQPHLISVHVWVERTGKWLRRGSRKGGEGEVQNGSDGQSTNAGGHSRRGDFITTHTARKRVHMINEVDKVPRVQLLLFWKDLWLCGFVRPYFHDMEELFPQKEPFLRPVEEKCPE